MHTENSTLSSVPLESVPHLWENNDILVFFIDLDNYDTLSAENLNNTEMEDLEKLQTSYFKKRFIVSRVILKHILYNLLNMESVLNISIYKDMYGGVHISDHEDLHICISYSENIAVLAISKVKIGIDIETKRPLELKHTLRYLYNTPSYSNKSVTDNDFLKIWTLKEAYCKFSNKSMFSFLNKEPDFNNVSCFYFVLDEKYIFSIVTGLGQYTISMNYLKKFI